MNRAPTGAAVAIVASSLAAAAVDQPTPAGTFEPCLKTEEATPFEPGDREHKLYVPGVSLVRDGPLVLVSRSLK